VPRAVAAANAIGPVFDAHVHVMPWHLAKSHIVETLQKTQPNHARYQDIVKDPRKFLELMDEEGVERACLINYVAPEVMGFPPEVNDWVAKYASADRERLVPVGGIHPLHVKDAKKEVERLLSKLELAAIKLHPVHSLFNVNDYALGGGALKVLYEACEREGVPVIVHTGTSIFPHARNRFGDPMAVDDVAVDYPKLKIVLAHCGRPLWMQTCQFLARRHPNVWLEISGIPPKSLLEYLPNLEKFAAKTVFGSDWPGPMIPSIRQNALDVAAQPLSKESQRAILYENARRLYG
jgi:predicted TIM-barrel fold metal-dependent hydrolase